MDIKITKKDILWSYIGRFFGIASSFITLPIVLHMLSPEEVGMNYLMATVSSLVGLLDFGFSPQFGRNFTYVNSGAKKLLKEGVDTEEILLKDLVKEYYRLSFTESNDRNC